MRAACAFLDTAAKANAHDPPSPRSPVGSRHRALPPPALLAAWRQGASAQRRPGLLPFRTAASAGRARARRPPREGRLATQHATHTGAARRRAWACSASSDCAASSTCQAPSRIAMNCRATSCCRSSCAARTGAGHEPSSKHAALLHAACCQNDVRVCELRSHAPALHCTPAQPAAPEAQASSARPPMRTTPRPRAVPAQQSQPSPPCPSGAPHATLGHSFREHHSSADTQVTLPGAPEPHPLIALGAKAAARHRVLHRQLQVDDCVGRRQAAVRRLSGRCTAGLADGQPRPTVASAWSPGATAASSGSQRHPSSPEHIQLGGALGGALDSFTAEWQLHAGQVQRRHPGCPGAGHPPAAQAQILPPQPRLHLKTMQSCCARLTRRLASTALGPPGLPPMT